MIGPGLRQGFGRQAGLRQGFGRRAGRLRRALVLGTLGAVSMALLLPSVAALRYTDAHDWYAAGKAGVAQALIFAGFDERAATEYRLADGRTVTSFREGVATYPAALRSRSLILAVIGDNILLGACAGFVVVFTLSGLLNLARYEPARMARAPARRPSGAERRPGFIEGVPPYAAHEPNRVPARAAPAAVGPRRNAAVPSPEPPVAAEPEDAYEPPARPRGRWF